MTQNELELIRQWDAKCGDNESTFFPVTKDRRRLIEYVDELRALLELCLQRVHPEPDSELKVRIDSVMSR